MGLNKDLTRKVFGKRFSSQSLNVSNVDLSGSLKDIRPANWCLSEDYQSYLQRPADDTNWVPEQEYYMKMVGRLVDSILVVGLLMV